MLVKTYLAWSEVAFSEHTMDNLFSLLALSFYEIQNTPRAQINNWHQRFFKSNFIKCLEALNKLKPALRLKLLSSFILQFLY